MVTARMADMGFTVFLAVSFFGMRVRKFILKFVVAVVKRNN
jgi:hypothetical protein